jgi:hypothetical protein
MGSYDCGLKAGLGIHAKSGDTYLGQFDNDSSHGWGMFRFASLGGEVYMGQWREGAFHGLGMYIESDGSMFVGGFVND